MDGPAGLLEAGLAFVGVEGPSSFNKLSKSSTSFAGLAGPLLTGAPRVGVLPLGAGEPRFTGAPLFTGVPRLGAALLTGAPRAGAGDPN